ncbi:MAG: ferrous iron transport protein A [Planctomycetota bacterium]
MTVPRTLAALAVGDRGRVTDLGGDEHLQQRLLELGLYPGAEVRLVRIAPLGDPLEFEVLGYHLSLRRVEAGSVHIEAVDP